LSTFPLLFFHGHRIAIESHSFNLGFGTLVHWQWWHINIGEMFFHNLSHSDKKICSVEINLKVNCGLFFNSNGTKTIGATTLRLAALFEPMKMKFVFSFKFLFAVLTADENNSNVHYYC
jgi:hypothetical protein